MYTEMSLLTIQHATYAVRWLERVHTDGMKTIFLTLRKVKRTILHQNKLQFSNVIDENTRKRLLSWNIMFDRIKILIENAKCIT